jgi:transaldolase
MSKIKELSKLGQSIWYDYIQRTMITSGQLADLVSKGLGGVTSNPSIFEHAITGSTDYDVDLNRLIAEDKSVNEIYESLAVEDIAMAADVLRTVYDATGSKDGFVSLEVNPGLAHQTEPTIAEARRLFETVGRPNVMIKVPATRAGIPAIAALIGAGVNVNVTLIFGLESYRDVAGAYIEGLEQLSQNGPAVQGGQGVNTIGSVASFFISRVDTAVDKALEKTGHPELQGKIAIANAKVAYAIFQEIFSGDRWDRLAAAGARVQRVLWASTGTKNPNYADTMYVNELIGRDTVNTLPPATLDSFLDHGTAAETLTVDVDEARRQLRQLDELGLDLRLITDQLQVEGVDAFARSFDSLMEGIAQKRKRRNTK